MSRTPHPQQQAVLDCTADRQLVSAGAGSGKTTVMIKKITDLLLSGQATTNQILVVTFTNLASIEMRERLVKNISEALLSATDNDEKLRIQNILDSIETSSVDTIDGFCSKMLKKYFYQADLEPEIKIISSFSQEYYINKALDLAIKQFNQTNERELIVLCDIFEKKARSLDTLKESLLRAFNYCICQKDYSVYLDSVLPQYKDLASPSAVFLNQYICDNVAELTANILRILPDFTEFPKLHKMLDNYCTHLVNINPNSKFEQNINILSSRPDCNFSTTERIKDSNDYKTLKFYANKLSDLLADFDFLTTLQDQPYVDAISSHLSSFIALLKLFTTTYAQLKQENNVMDFSDLERKMLDLLKQESIISDFHDTYKYVFVDEYQDINPMQDELINILLSSSSKLFLVGDVKQSIYGFRQSTPELFINAYKSYKNNPQLGTSFDMTINYRSHPQILEFNNEIFSHLMTDKSSDIDYAGTSKFSPQRTDFPTSQAVEILISNTDAEQEQETVNGLYSISTHSTKPTLSASEIEAQLVLNKIKQLVGTDFYDSATQQTRKLEYSDIAILSRGINNDKVQNLANLLTQNGLPINISKHTDLKDSEAINKVLSLLRVISHTASDIDYAYLFTCPLVNITYNQLLDIYTNHDLNLYQNLTYYSENYNDELALKIKYGFNLCNEFRLISSTLNVKELIYTLLNKYHLRQHLIASEKGYEQLNILDEFLNSLSNEEQNLTIAKFIDLIEKNLNSGSDNLSRDSVNSITIQTIHASKGLEYPIVILFNCGQQFTYLTEHNDLNFDLDFGIGMQYYDLNARKRQESPTRYAIKIKNKIKAFKEELRLLYVATTRAKNKLIITGCCSEEKLKSNTLSKDNFINLILSAYYDKINTNSLADTYSFTNCDIEIVNDLPMCETVVSNTEKSLTDDNVIGHNLNYVYPYLNQTNISIKNNVTALSRTINDEYNIAPVRLNLKENLQANVDDLAQIGTLYHSVLSNINYNKPYTTEPREGIDENLIRTAYDKICPLAKNYIRQLNEKQFMMYVPYCDIYPDSDIDTKILVQGVVDLILEFDDHIILVDYKYSSLPIKSLCKKYSTQLMLYKMAIERAYKKPVTHSYIYSIKTGELG